MSMQQLPPPSVLTIDDIIIQAVKWGKGEDRSIRIEAWDKGRIITFDSSDSQWTELERVGSKNKRNNENHTANNE